VRTTAQRAPSRLRQTLLVILAGALAIGIGTNLPTSQSATPPAARPTRHLSVVPQPTVSTEPSAITSAPVATGPEERWFHLQGHWDLPAKPGKPHVRVVITVIVLGSAPDPTPSEDPFGNFDSWVSTPGPGVMLRIAPKTPEPRTPKMSCSIHDEHDLPIGIVYPVDRTGGALCVAR